MIVHCFLCHPLPFQPVHHDSLRFCSWLAIIPKAMWSSSIRERHTITFLPIIKDQDMCFQWYCHDLWYYNTSTNAYALYSSEHIEFKVWNLFPPCCILPGHGKTSCIVLQNNPLNLTEFLSLFFFQVKIQKMRSNLEEKLMRRMTTVHRRAEEWRATAQAQHLQQLKRAAEQVRRAKATSHHHHHHHLAGSNASCGCFPCNGGSNIISGNLLNYY